MNIKAKIRESILKFLGLETYLELPLINQTIQQMNQKLENCLDDLDSRIDDLERNEILGYSSDDFVASNDYDDLEAKVEDILDRDILEYDSGDFVNTSDFDALANDVMWSLKAISKLAEKVDMKQEIKNMLGGRDGEI